MIELKCSKCKSSLVNKGSYVKHINSCILDINTKINIKNDYLVYGLSIRKLALKYNTDKSIFYRYVLLSKLFRNSSDAAKLARKKYPENFKHSDESKNKMREARLKWMMENPEKTAWRKSNMSYPEKLMYNKFLELGWDKKHLVVIEKSIFPYFIDFAFENDKVALEIDGSQHLLIERKLKDIEKDKTLNDNGWRVIRVTASEVMYNIDNVILELNKFLVKSNNINSNIGILKENKKYKLKDRDENGYTSAMKESQINQRKVERPNYSTLIDNVKEFGYTKTGKKYGVSDNCIRKWIKIYEKNNLE